MCKIWIALLVMAPCLFAHGDQKNCKEVSGGIVTNFLTESGTVNGQQFVFTTLGTATGDLRGGLGVYIFSITPGPNNSVVAKVHHHWVTDAGDTHICAGVTIAFTVNPQPVNTSFPLIFSLGFTSFAIGADTAKQS